MQARPSVTTAAVRLPARAVIVYGPPAVRGAVYRPVLLMVPRPVTLQKKPDGMTNTVGVGTTPEGFRFVYQQWEMLL